jgi:hypothetical protein
MAGFVLSPGPVFRADAIRQALPAAVPNPDDGRRFSKET